MRKVHFELRMTLVTTLFLKSLSPSLLGYSLFVTWVLSESLLVIEPSSFGAKVVREDKEVVIGTMDEEISLDCMLVLTSLGVELNCG